MTSEHNQMFWWQVIEFSSGTWPSPGGPAKLKAYFEDQVHIVKEWVEDLPVYRVHTEGNQSEQDRGWNLQPLAPRLTI